MAMDAEARKSFERTLTQIMHERTGSTWKVERLRGPAATGRRNLRRLPAPTEVESIAKGLADWRERNGRWPTAADIERDRSLPGKSTVHKYLGTVSAAKFAELVPEILAPEKAEG
jgi:hypothetical protein